MIRLQYPTLATKQPTSIVYPHSYTPALWHVTFTIPTSLVLPISAHVEYIADHAPPSTPHPEPLRSLYAYAPTSSVDAVGSR